MTIQLIQEEEIFQRVPESLAIISKKNLVFLLVATSCLKFLLFSAITWKLQYSYKNRVYWNTKEETMSSGKEKRTAETWFCVHTQNEKSINLHQKGKIKF